MGYIGRRNRLPDRHQVEDRIGGSAFAHTFSLTPRTSGADRPAETDRVPRYLPMLCSDGGYAEEVRNLLDKLLALRSAAHLTAVKLDPS